MRLAGGFIYPPHPPTHPTRLNSGRFDHLCSDYIGPWQAEHGLVKVAGFIVHDWWRGEGKGLVALGENLWGKKKKAKLLFCWRTLSLKLLLKRKKIIRLFTDVIV